MASSSSRIVWVDYAKALAILGVFFLHGAVAGDRFAVIVAAFDMMVFFFLSGFVFSIQKHPTFLPFLWKKIRTLVVPGVFFVTVTFIVERVIDALQGRFLSVSAYAKWLLGCLLNMRGHAGFGNIPWFLTCLFLIEIGGYVLLHLIRIVVCRWNTNRDALLVAITAVALTAGWAYSVVVGRVLPWSGDIALSMFGFFVLGLIAREHRLTLERFLSVWAIIPALLILVIAVIINRNLFGYEVNVYLNRYGNPICYMLGAIAGIWAVLSICRAMERIVPVNTLLGRGLSYFGRNTLTFYCVNDGIYPQFIPALLGLIGLQASTIAAGTPGQAVYAWCAILINIVFCIPCAAFMNRFLPEVLGKKRFKTSS
ncbi:acyltransferase family protein [Bifidobacterium callimiconis]|nr:acyltransferase family protein [Bifidobacterium callimiconis]